MLQNELNYFIVYTLDYKIQKCNIICYNKRQSVFLKYLL